MGPQSISAITFAVREMRRAVEFYEKCGFQVTYGGLDTPFTTLRSAEVYVNLVATAEYRGQWWGRVIFRVANVDEQYRRMIASGLQPHASPQDAVWGERYFHITDPDGHELSFAEMLPTSSI